MYAKMEQGNRVNFFIIKGEDGTPTEQKHEKVFYGRISEPINTNEKGEDGKDIYEYETWDARFVGRALEKAKGLADKTRITLKEWSARNPYNKEKKRSYPYLLVMDFDITVTNG